MPYLVAAKKAPDGDFLIQGVLVTKDNVDAMLKIADDMAKDAKDFPFDKPLKDVVAQYTK